MDCSKCSRSAYDCSACGRVAVCARVRACFEKKQGNNCPFFKRKTKAALLRCVFEGSICTRVIDGSRCCIVEDRNGLMRRVCQKYRGQ